MSAKPTREENPSLQPRRRALLQAGAAMTLAAASVVQPGAQPIIMNSSSELMPRSGKRRVVILGGGWGGMGHYAIEQFYRAAYRLYIKPDVSYQDIGFRCAKDAR